MFSWKNEILRLGNGNINRSYICLAQHQKYAFKSEASKHHFVITASKSQPKDTMFDPECVVNKGKKLKSIHDLLSNR